MKIKQLHIVFSIFMILNFTVPFSAQEIVEEVIESVEVEENPYSNVKELKSDTQQITPLTAPDNLNEKYSGQDFDYEHETESGDNFISEFFDWFFRKLNDIFGIHISPEMAEILQYFVYAILGIFSIWLIVKLLTNQSPKALFQKSQLDLGTVSFEEEHIESVDFKKLLNDALRTDNYRLAVRYLYLDALKSLSEKGLVKWHNEKTNFEYLMELKNAQIKNEFKDLSYVYDNVWYGEFELNPQEFNRVKSQYQQFQNQLN